MVCVGAQLVFQVFDRFIRGLPIERRFGRQIPHPSPDAAANAAVPFSLPDPEAVQTELAAAGFHDIESSDLPIDVAFPSPGEFARRFVTSTSLEPFTRGRDDAVERVVSSVESECTAWHAGPGSHRTVLAYRMTGWLG